MSLDQRRPPTELLDVVGACGIQDTPPGNAEVSLAARLDIDRPVVADALRSAGARPHLVAAGIAAPPCTHDLAAFALGARPADGTPVLVMVPFSVAAGLVLASASRFADEDVEAVRTQLLMPVT